MRYIEIDTPKHNTTFEATDENIEFLNARGAIIHAGEGCYRIIVDHQFTYDEVIVLMNLSEDATP